MERSLIRRIVALGLAFALAGSFGVAGAADRSVEKNANLDIALRVRSLLRARGVQVVMTRTTDRSLEPATRTGLANRNDVDAFISIHNNASSNRSARGSIVFHQLRGRNSKSLATFIRSELRDELGAQRPTRIATRRGSNGDYYYQLRQPSMPAVIVEAAFVSNPTEGRALASSPAYRAKIAEAIANGVLAYQRTLVARRAPRPDPGTVVPAPFAPPSSGAARALGATRVSLSFTMPPLADGYRVYRDGKLLATRRAAPGARVRFTDVWGAPGQTYAYEMRGISTPVDGVTAEGVALELTAKTPAISVVLDPGHGGRDPGAVYSY